MSLMLICMEVSVCVCVGGGGGGQLSPAAAWGGHLRLLMSLMLICMEVRVCVCGGGGGGGDIWHEFFLNCLQFHAYLYGGKDDKC